MDLEKLFYEHGEIEFSYNNNHYMISCFNVRKTFRKSRIEYWLFPPSDSSQELQKFNTIDELLDTEIDGHKLRDIWDDIEVDNTY